LQYPADAKAFAVQMAVAARAAQQPPHRHKRFLCVINRIHNRFVLGARITYLLILT
jgi:hypothetical protein